MVWSSHTVNTLLAVPGKGTRQNSDVWINIKWLLTKTVLPLIYEDGFICFVWKKQFIIFSLPKLEYFIKFVYVLSVP